MSLASGVWPANRSVTLGGSYALPQHAKAGRREACRDKPKTKTPGMVLTYRRTDMEPCPGVQLEDLFREVRVYLEHRPFCRAHSDPEPRPQGVLTGPYGRCCPEYPEDTSECPPVASRGVAWRGVAAWVGRPPRRDPRGVRLRDAPPSCQVASIASSCRASASGTVAVESTRSLDTVLVADVNGMLDRAGVVARGRLPENVVTSRADRYYIGRHTVGTRGTPGPPTR